METAAIKLFTNGTAGDDKSTMVMLDHLWEKVQGRVKALEEASGDDKATGSEPAVMKRVEELTARVEALAQVDSRVTALETSKRTTTDRDLTTLAERLKKLERAQPQVAMEARDTSKAFARLERLSGSVAALEETQKTDARALSDRLSTMEKILGGLVNGLERLSAQVAGLDEMPKRVVALEEAKAPAAEKVLTSITKRLDRLSTQITNYKDVPEWMAAAERASARADALAGGLHRAIDSIDLLSAQVTALQSGAPTASAPPSAPSRCSIPAHSVPPAVPPGSSPG